MMLLAGQAETRRCPSGENVSEVTGTCPGYRSKRSNDEANLRNDIENNYIDCCIAGWCESATKNHNIQK